MSKTRATEMPGRAASDEERDDDDGAIPREDLHAYAVRQGAPAEMVQERPDSSSADPNQEEVDRMLEDLEGQSIIDPMARPDEAVEVFIPVGTTVEEAAVLLDRIEDPSPLPERLTDKLKPNKLRNRHIF